MQFENSQVTQDLLDRLLDSRRSGDVAGVLGELARAISDNKPDPYEVELTLAAAGDLVPVTQKVWPYTAIELCEEILADGDLPRDVRFLALAVALTRCRRLRSPARARRLVQRFGSEFEGEPLFWQFKALSYEWGGRGELFEGLEAAREADRRMPGNPGAQHAVASFTAEIANFEDLPRQQLQEALSCVERALSARPDRARFYYTRARLHRQLARWDDRHWDLARDDVLTAIEREDVSRFDGPQRVRDYQLELALVDTGRHVQQQLKTVAGRLDTKLGELDRRLSDGFRDNQFRVVETLGLFTAVIALIFASVQVSTGRTTWTPDQALLVLGFTTLFVFVALVGGVGLLGLFRWLGNRYSWRQRSQPEGTAARSER